MSSPAGAGQGADSRGQMWYCYQCQREMQPLMLPDPHCAHCRGTFVEQLEADADTNPDHDPRRWAAEGDDEWVDDDGAPGGPGAMNPFAQLLGLIGGAAGGGARVGPMFAEPGAMPDEDYDGQNPFAEGHTGHDGHGGHPRPEREGGGEPGIDRPQMPPHLRQDSDSMPFLQALLGMNPQRQQQHQQGDQQRDEGGGSGAQAGPSGRVFTRTFGGGPQGGGGMFSVTIGTPTGLQPRDRQQQPGQEGENQAGEQVPITNLASFIHQAFGAPPAMNQDQPQRPRRPSDPSADRPRPNRADVREAGFDAAGGRPEQPLDYLMSVFSVLNGGPPINRGSMGDFVFSERGFQDVLNQLMEQMEGRYGPRPATEDKIASLKRVTMTKEMLAAPTITDCAICKDEFAEGDQCIVLPCKHIFHTEDCALPWLKQNGTCPVCRYSLVEDPQDDPADAPAGFSAAATTRPHSPARTFSGRPPQPPRNGSLNSLLSPPLEGSVLPGAFPDLDRPRGAEVEMTPPPAEAGPSGSGSGPAAEGETSEKSLRELRAEAAERRAAATPNQGQDGSAATRQQYDGLDLD